MSKLTQNRKKVALVFFILLGLVIGNFIKRVSLGLLIGIALGVLVGGLLSSKK